MNFGVYQNKEILPFSKIPVYLLDQIMAKMTFETYANFIQTGKLSEHMNNRNHKLKYPLMNMKIDKIHIERTLQNPSTWVAKCYIDLYNFVKLSIDLCEKIQFQHIAVTISDDWPDKKVCELLQNLNKITTLDCNYPHLNQPHVLEFFMNAEIHNLFMSTDRRYPINSFCIDTSNNERVEILDCRMISPETLWSIKAKQELVFCLVEITADQLINYIELMKSGNAVPYLYIYQGTMHNDEFRTFMDFLIQHGVYQKEGRFSLFCLNEMDPCVIAHVFDDYFSFVKQK